MESRQYVSPLNQQILFALRCLTSGWSPPLVKLARLTQYVNYRKHSNLLFLPHRRVHYLRRDRQNADSHAHHVFNGVVYPLPDGIIRLEDKGMDELMAVARIEAQFKSEWV